MEDNSAMQADTNHGCAKEVIHLTVLERRTVFSPTATNIPNLCQPSCQRWTEKTKPCLFPQDHEACELGEKPSQRWWPGQHFLPLSPADKNVWQLRRTAFSVWVGRRLSPRSHTLRSVGALRRTVGACAGRKNGKEMFT